MRRNKKGAPKPRGAPSNLLSDFAYAFFVFNAFKASIKRDL
jgi:hypothetical protein